MASDWRAAVQSLLLDTESNLRRVRRATNGSAEGATTPTKKSGAPPYALLRAGVSPGDPHLIAPALADSEAGLIKAVSAPAPFASSYPPGFSCHPLPVTPTPPAAAALAPSAALELEALRRQVGEVGSQLAALRTAAAGWQAAATKVDGVDSRCTAQGGQIAELSTQLADLAAGQGQAEAAGAERQQQAEAHLAALGSKVDALAAAAAAAAASTAAAAADRSSGGVPAAELAPLAERLAQTEQALARLQADVERQAAAAPRAMEAAAAAAAVAAMAGLQAEVSGLRGQVGRAAERGEAAQQDVARLAGEVQALHSAQGSAAQQATAQHALLSGQLAELQAAHAAHAGAATQQSGRVEQLAAEVARMAAQLDEHQQQLAQAADAVGPDALHQLAAQVEASNGAIAALQEQMSQLAALQAALDDANQRLFELRVEVQNGAEDAGIMAASTKRQAEEADAAAAAAALMAEGLQQELGQVQAQLEEQLASATAHAEQTAEESRQQVQAEVDAWCTELAGELAAVAGAASAAAAAATAGLSQTVDQVVSELAGLKLQLAQQREAAEVAEAGARRSCDGAASPLEQVQAQVAALEQRLDALAASPRGKKLANAAETAACLATLSDIVHKQRDEMQQVKAVMSSVGQDAAALASAQREMGAQQQDAVEALQAAVEQLRQQAEAAAVDTYRHSEELEGMRRQLAAAQLGTAAVEGAAAASAGVQGGDPHPSVAAMQQRLDRLEAAVAGQRSGERETGGPCRRSTDGSSSATAEEGSPASMAALHARIAALEAVLASSRGGDGGAEQAQQAQQQQEQQQMQAVAALATLVEGMQRQLDALFAAQQALAAPAPAAEEQVDCQPAVLRQQVDERVCRTEATVASALEEVAGQMAALAARVEQAEAAALASAAAAQAAVAEAQQQVGTVQGFVSQQQLSRQASLRQSAEAAVQHSNGGGGLFARIGCSFSSQPVSRRTTGGSSDSREAGVGSAAALAEQADIPLRQQWSSNGEQEVGSRHSVSREASSRRSSGAAGSGSTTPRSSGGKFTPRSRPAGTGQWAAALQQERSGGSVGGGDGRSVRSGRSGGSTPRQEPSALSSFGDVALPLPQSSSYLGTPREEAAERARAIEAELAVGGLDDVQREVLASDLQRLQQRLGL